MGLASRRNSIIIIGKGINQNEIVPGQLNSIRPARDDATTDVVKTKVS